MVQIVGDAKSKLLKRKTSVTHPSMISFQFHKHDWAWLGYLFQWSSKKIFANHDDQLLNKASFEESLDAPETQFAKQRSTSQRFVVRIFITCLWKRWNLNGITTGNPMLYQ